jgi:hypothetical protein
MVVRPAAILIGMRNQPLTPTVIVDKNNKVTTVHKRQEQASAGRKSIPAPALRKNVSTTPAGTPLPVPPLLNPEQIEEFIARNDLPDITFKGGLSGEKILAEMLSVEDVSLIKELIDTGRMTRRSVKLLSTAVSPHPEQPHTHNALLIAEQLIASSRVRIVGDNTADMMLVTMAVEGLRYHNAPGKGPLPRITTKEDLTRYTAVAEFVLLQLGMGGNKTDAGIRTRRIRDHNGESNITSVTENKHLEALIMERPDDVGVISAYVNERGMHKSLKTPVNTLRTYLDQTKDASAIREGWL